MQIPIKILLTGLSILLVLGCSNRPKRLAVLENDYTAYTLTSEFGQCKVTRDFIDPVTGVRKTDLESVRLFTYTHEELKKSFTTGPFLICESYLSRIDNKQFLLNIDFILQANKILPAYSALKEEATLILELINGDRIVLTNINGDSGIKEGDNFIFKTIYAMSGKNLRLLRKHEINRLGITWKGGFESYDVHEIDFFMLQLDCFTQI